METEKEIKELEYNLKHNVSYTPIKTFWEKELIKDKSGKKISLQEFGKRWKEGMQNLTPKQRTQNDIFSSWVILVGFIVSTIALIFFNKTFGVVTYGLILIFLGNTYANAIKLFSLYGQLKVFKNIEEMTMEVQHGDRRSVK